MRGKNSHHRRRGAHYRPRADMNVTPLVDVMLVLLIVFMISAPLLSVGVPVDLPKTEAKALPSQKDPLTITVDREGGIYLQEEPVNFGSLPTRLGALAENGYDERVYLRADAETDYGLVMQVMARLNVAGFSNIGLVTDSLTDQPVEAPALPSSSGKP